MLLKVRAIALGFLVLLVAGAIASAMASAAPGPFWNHRENPGEGNGLKISPQSPESFAGTGGTQTLTGEIAGVKVKLVAAGVKVTGTIWNNSLQGQIKLRLKFTPITIVEPVLANCQAEAFSQPGGHNVVYSEGHLGWTWNGEATQKNEQPIVNQKPDIIFVSPGKQIQQDATALPEGTFAEVKFSGSACGVLAGITAPVKGTTVGELVQPSTVGAWSNTLTVATLPGENRQHFWNGKEFIGVTTGLIFNTLPSSFVGEDTVETIRQEVSISEK